MSGSDVGVWLGVAVVESACVPKMLRDDLKPFSTSKLSFASFASFMDPIPPVHLF